MKLKINSRIALNAAAGVLAKASSAIVRVLTVPALLLFWDVKTIGVWLMISSIPGWLSLSDVGLGTMAANEISTYGMQGEWNAARRTFFVARRIVVSATLFIAVISVPVLILMKANLMAMASFSNSDLVACYILIVSSLVSIQRGVYQGHYRAVSKYHVSILFMNCMGWVELCCLGFGLWIRPDFLSASISLLAARIITTVSFIWYARVVCPDLNRDCLDSSIGSDFWRLLKGGGAFCVYPLTNAILMDGTLVVIGVACGLEIVPGFSLMRSLSRLGIQLTELVKLSTWNEFAALASRNEVAGFRALYRRGLCVCMSSAVLVFVVLLFIGPVVFEISSKGRLHLNMPTFVILCFTAIPYAYWTFSGVVFESRNRHLYLATTLLILSVVTIGLELVLPPYIGLIGVSVALVVMELSMSAVVYAEIRGLFSRGPNLFVTT